MNQDFCAIFTVIFSFRLAFYPFYKTDSDIWGQNED